MYLSISKNILAWYQKHQRLLPWRNYKNQKDRHYKVLLSEFMLQQTQVKTAIPYFINFYKNIGSLKKLSKTKLTKINKLWQGLGYYRRAKFLSLTSKIIEKKYNSHIPNKYEDLIKLPGIGDYTAKAILSIGFDKSEIGIDGNIERVISRVFKAQNKKDIFRYTDHLKVKKKSSFLMQGLMELGALICKPKKPSCIECPIKKYCKFFKNGKINKTKIIKIPKKIKKIVACIFIKRNKVLLSNKNSLGPLKGFLNVPLIEVESNGHQKALNQFFNQKIIYSPIGKFNISISNFKAAIQLIKIKQLKKIDKTFSLLSQNQLKNRFISSFLKKILKKIKFIK